MRIERTGPVEPLTPRVVRYLEEGLRARSLDDPQSSEQRRPDYVCLKEILVIELKTLAGDGTERVENLNDQLRNRPDYPLFYGKVPVESLLKNLSDGDEVRRNLTNRVGRAIISHLDKADDQLKAHADRVGRKNLVRLVVLINEDHELYEPQSVAFIVAKAFARMKDGKPECANVDAVVYMTERHGAQVQGMVAFPLSVIFGPGAKDAPWKVAFVNQFLDGWATWNKSPIYDSGTNFKIFETIKHIPDRMKRQELWSLEYRRAPYMKAFTDDQIRDRFDEIDYDEHAFDDKWLAVQADAAANNRQSPRVHACAGGDKSAWNSLAKAGLLDRARFGCRAADQHAQGSSRLAG